MNIEQKIRAQIEKNRDLKLEIGYINNHLSILEGLLRNERDDVQKQVDEAYQKGYDKGYADKTNNDEVGKELAKDVYQRGLEDGKEYREKGCEGCKWEDKEYNICTTCRNSYKNRYERKDADDDIKVGDEVIYIEHKFIVFATETEEQYASLFDVNGRHASASQKDCKKTGRHFDIQKILEEMKE